MDSRLCVWQSVNLIHAINYVVSLTDGTRVRFRVVRRTFQANRHNLPHVNMIFLISCAKFLNFSSHASFFHSFAYLISCRLLNFSSWSCFCSIQHQHHYHTCVQYWCKLSAPCTLCIQMRHFCCRSIQWAFQYLHWRLRTFESHHDYHEHEQN